MNKFNFFEIQIRIGIRSSKFEVNNPFTQQREATIIANKVNKIERFGKKSLHTTIRPS
jgi:hypothetical protein